MMGDRYYACITFGGAIPQAAIEEIIAAIEESCLESIDCDSLTNADEIRAYLFAWLEGGADRGEHVCLSDNEANYGRIEPLESVLRRHGIAYSVDQQPNSEGPYRTFWSPTREFCIGIEDGSPCLNLDRLKARLTDGDTLANVIAELETYEPAFAPLSIIPADASAETPAP